MFKKASRIALIAVLAGAPSLSEPVPDLESDPPRCYALCRQMHDLSEEREYAREHPALYLLFSAADAMRMDPRTVQYEPLVVLFTHYVERSYYTQRDERIREEIESHMNPVVVPVVEPVSPELTSPESAIAVVQETESTDHFERHFEHRDMFEGGGGGGDFIEHDIGGPEYRMHNGI